MNPLAASPAFSEDCVGIFLGFAVRYWCLLVSPVSGVSDSLSINKKQGLEVAVGSQPTKQKCSRLWLHSTLS